MKRAATVPRKSEGAVENSGRTHSGRFTDIDADKLRGGFYTSTELACWLCDWAIRTTEDRVLEPSCGDGVFLEAALGRMEKLGAHGPAIANHLSGTEILSDEAKKARDRLKARLGLRAGDIVETSDFFAWWMRPEGEAPSQTN